METRMMNHLIDGLKRAGLRLTPQRVAICRLLAESKDHPTASMIYHALLPQFPTLSLATVYKTLDVLKRLGLVQSLGDAGDGCEHYDADLTPHINLVCVRCHRVSDYVEEAIQQVEQRVAERSGYEIQGARIVYYGLCPTCRNGEKTPQIEEQSSGGVR
ncbi:Peroxide-responsive repressor PerR [bacterium HR15]|nr:Peroxide-responsive repressor PerR [bacterium HR15]